MLQCVPAPFPDEVGRGYAQRVWARSGGSLTGASGLLSKLAEITGLSELHLLRQHSHQGYVRMVSVAHAGVDMSCHADRWANPMITLMKLPSGKARFCPSCVSEDIGFHGIDYWRRAHQLPGVSVCTKHAVVLLEVSIDRLLRRSPSQCREAVPVLAGREVDAYVQNELIQRFVTLSDMALQLTTPIAAAVIANVLTQRRNSIASPRRQTLAAMVRDLVPDSWLSKHFPAFIGKDESDRVASIDDILRSRHVAHATKSYLLVMAALWQNPDDAMRECLVGAQEGAMGFNLAGGERALAAVMGGKSIKSACRAEGIHLRDFEQALRCKSVNVTSNTGSACAP